MRLFVVERLLSSESKSLWMGVVDGVDAHAQVIDLKRAIPGLDDSAAHAQASCQLEILATSSIVESVVVLAWPCCTALCGQPRLHGIVLKSQSR